MTSKEKQVVIEALKSWGSSLPLLEYKRTELKRIHELRAEYLVFERTYSKTESTNKIIDGFSEQIDHIEKQIYDLLSFKQKIDNSIYVLSERELLFVHLRFTCSKSFTAIEHEMNYSRASLFRIQDSVLDKLYSAINKKE